MSTLPRLQEPSVSGGADRAAQEAGKRSLRISLALLGLAYLACLLIYPQDVMTVRDEANYIGVTQYILQEKNLRLTDSPRNHDGLVPWFTEKNGRRIPGHPLGVSFLAVPFVLLLGWKGCHLLSVAFLFLGAWFFKKILEAEGFPAGYVYLYLLFPPLMLYSRFFMSDVPSVALCLGGLYFLRWGRLGKRSAFWGMVCLGVAFLVRPTNAFFIGPMAIWALWTAYRNRKHDLIPVLILTGLVFFAAQLALNAYYLGNPLLFSYSVADRFALRYFTRNLLFYVLALISCYPLMILGLEVAARRRRFLEIVLFALGFLFYCFYNYVDRDFNPVFWIVRGQRFLLPFVAVLLVFYAGKIQRVPFLDQLFRRYPLVLAAAGIVGIIAVAQMQSRYNEVALAAKSWVYENSSAAPEQAIIYNIDSSEFIHGVYGDRQYHLLRSGNQFPAEFEEVALSAETILVAETDHRYRHGKTYTDKILQGDGWAGFSVVDRARFGASQLLLLRRGGEVVH